jgi:MtN3 and saliva related transmembrane protein
MTLNVIGMLAGALTTLSLIPQVIKVYRCKSAGDFAWGYLGMFWIGLVFWIAYGIARKDWPIILTNAITLALSLMVGGMKVRYRSGTAKPPF